MGSAAVAAGPLQLVNLRHFNSHVHTKLTPGRAQNHKNVVARSTAGLEILKNAEELQPQAVPVPIVDLESVPPFEEWHRHPNLLAGYAQVLNSSILQLHKTTFIN